MPGSLPGVLFDGVAYGSLLFLMSAALGAVLERTLYRPLYRRGPLDQVLFSLGLTLMAVAATTWFFGPGQRPVRLPSFLLGQLHLPGLGLGVHRVFALTFILGSGLAALGGALSIDVLGLDPTFPLKYLVYFLLVVVVGGAGTIAGPLAASMVLGVFDVAGKYYVPEAGAFVIYGLMVALLLLFPGGLRRLAR